MHLRNKDMLYIYKIMLYGFFPWQIIKDFKLALLLAKDGYSDTPGVH